MALMTLVGVVSKQLGEAQLVSHKTTRPDRQPFDRLRRQNTAEANTRLVVCGTEGRSLVRNKSRSFVMLTNLWNNFAPTQMRHKPSISRYGNPFATFHSININCGVLSTGQGSTTRMHVLNSSDRTHQFAKGLKTASRRNDTVCKAQNNESCSTLSSTITPTTPRAAHCTRQFTAYVRQPKTHDEAENTAAGLGPGEKILFLQNIWGEAERPSQPALGLMIAISSHWGMSV